mgnify:CR=1 FL=1
MTFSFPSTTQSARQKHRWRVGDREFVEYACWRCGYRLGEAASDELWPGYTTRWGFAVPPGFKPVVADPENPNAPAVLRPTKKRRQAWLKERRKADKSSFSRLTLREGSNAWLPFRDPDRSDHRGDSMRVLLPHLMECERCGAVNKLEAPKEP